MNTTPSLKGVTASLEKYGRQRRPSGYFLHRSYSPSPSRAVFWGGVTLSHVCMSDATTKDGKWVSGSQNGRCLLFTNLIILFSSRWVRWVITPSAYKSHGWCTSHTVAVRTIALREGALLVVAAGHQSGETQMLKTSKYTWVDLQQML